MGLHCQALSSLDDLAADLGNSDEEGQQGHDAEASAMDGNGRRCVSQALHVCFATYFYNLQGAT
jgi:hypothetical protein